MKYKFGPKLKGDALNMDCTQCGHEMDAGTDKCNFCGAPRFRKSLLAWPPVEPAKWAMLGMFVYGIFQLSFYF